MPEQGRNGKKQGEQERPMWESRIFEGCIDEGSLNGNAETKSLVNPSMLKHYDPGSKQRDSHDMREFRTQSGDVDPSVPSSQNSVNSFIKHGQVWKLGKMWSVGSSFRLWRTRYLVVQDGYALLYTDEKNWRNRQEPKCRVKLRGARVEKHIGELHIHTWCQLD
jgi:hypothetical protein